MKLLTKESKRETCHHCGCGRTVTVACPSDHLSGLYVITCTACQITKRPFPALNEAQRAWIKGDISQPGGTEE